MKFQVGHTTNVRHGHTFRGKITPEYQCWSDIKARCLKPEHKFFEYYGGRGITICDEWKDDFSAFLAHVGPRPSQKHTIDRHPNNDGNYEPNNVRWATRKEQIDNRRSTVFVTIEGKKVPISNVIQERGIERRLVMGRIERGWTPERAIAEPAKWRRPDLTAKAIARKKAKP